MTAPVWDGQGRDPWLPQRLDARLEAAAVERDIRASVWAALSDWLIQLSRRMLREDRPPDLDAVWAIAPLWREAVDLILAGEIFKALDTAFRRIVGPGSGWDQRPAMVSYLAQVRNRLVRIPEEVYDLVAGQVSTGVNLGESIPELSRRIDTVLSTTGSERWPNRATVIARTETIGALNAGRYEAFRMIVEDDPGTAYELMWLATEDHRTRPTHVEAEGQRVPVGSTFSVGGFPLAFPGDPSGPPQEVIQCVVGSTQVGWPGQGVLGSTRRRHLGSLIQVITAEGHDLTVTPNHPVLTTTGYVPAGLLSKGQHVLATIQPPAPQVRNAPPSAEQVHSALSQAGEPERVMGSRMDFHGDGADTEVEVVSADRNLSHYVDAHGFGQPLEMGLIRPSYREVPLSGLSGAVVVWEPVPGTAGLYSAGRLVSRRGEEPPLSGGHARHPDAVSLAGITDLETQLSETPDQGRTAESDFPAHLQYALAAGMAPTEIVQVNRLTGHHWVYNLTTSDHWFTGNGIALHNCRCTMLLVEPDESVDLSNRQMRRSR